MARYQRTEFSILLRLRVVNSSDLKAVSNISNILLAVQLLYCIDYSIGFSALDVESLALP